ncbi:F-box protein PP2-B10-like [Spinacia oleracea]|uniref:F-box protein PP2-B10-like n=1 Tax=Spinacia oleracea TaxID=3562 RepID=A0A9R0HXR0_SPIOL|nr:F-box protein PP2-B10-like [Spinacia oleracea]
MTCMNLSSLPEECISHILSLISPTDVIRSSAVSKQLLSASESDTIWVKFLPFDIDLIISESSTTLDQQQLTSKKKLFLHLCRYPLLFNNNTLSFSLDIQSGKKCYMLSASTLVIPRGDTPDCWVWKSDPKSRFPKVIELQWIDITGKIHTKMLSPNTTYGVYFVFKLGIKYPATFEHTSVKLSVLELDEGLPRNDQHHLLRRKTVHKEFYLKTPVESEIFKFTEQFRRHVEAVQLPTERCDGWMEIELERYNVGSGGDGGGDNGSMVLEICMRDVDGLNWKAGLLVQGIELRPLD